MKGFFLFDKISVMMYMLNLLINFYVKLLIFIFL